LNWSIHISCLRRLTTALALTVTALSSAAQTSNFSNFNPLVSSVAAASLPEKAPFQFGNSAWAHRTIADRATQLATGRFNSGSWDRIDGNRIGVYAGRYLFMGFETGQAGIQRYDRLTATMTTLWSAPAPGGAVNFDAVRWTSFGSCVTAEESWGAQPQPHGRLFELGNPVSATVGAGNLMHINAVARVSHEGLAFDRNNSPYYIGELNGGSIYRYSSATPIHSATCFSGGTNPVLRVGVGVAESVSRWATLSTVGAEPTALYFDISNPNLGFVNVQHPDRGVGRLIEISAVPQPASYVLMLAGLGVVGAVVPRRCLA
jgi:hypothetical protein